MRILKPELQVPRNVTIFGHRVFGKVTMAGTGPEYQVSSLKEGIRMQTDTDTEESPCEDMGRGNRLQPRTEASKKPTS